MAGSKVDAVGDVALPALEMGFLVSVGLLLVQRGFLNRNWRHWVAQLLTAVLLPALVLHHVLAGSFASSSGLVLVSLNTVLSAGLGAAAGLAAARGLGLPPSQGRLLVVFSAFGSTGIPALSGGRQLCTAGLAAAGAAGVDYSACAATHAGYASAALALTLMLMVPAFGWALSEQLGGCLPLVAAGRAGPAHGCMQPSHELLALPRPLLASGPGDAKLETLACSTGQGVEGNAGGNYVAPPSAVLLGHCPTGAAEQPQQLLVANQHAAHSGQQTTAVPRNAADCIASGFLASSSAGGSLAGGSVHTGLGREVCARLSGGSVEEEHPFVDPLPIKTLRISTARGPLTPDISPCSTPCSEHAAAGELGSGRAGGGSAGELPAADSLTSLVNFFIGSAIDDFFGQRPSSEQEAVDRAACPALECGWDLQAAAGAAEGRGSQPWGHCDWAPTGVFAEAGPKMGPLGLGAGGEGKAAGPGETLGPENCCDALQHQSSSASSLDGSSGGSSGEEPDDGVPFDAPPLPLSAAEWAVQSDHHHHHHLHQHQPECHQQQPEAKQAEPERVEVLPAAPDLELGQPQQQWCGGSACSPPYVLAVQQQQLSLRHAAAGSSANAISNGSGCRGFWAGCRGAAVALPAGDQMVDASTPKKLRDAGAVPWQVTAAYPAATALCAGVLLSCLHAHGLLPRARGQLLAPLALLLQVAGRCVLPACGLLLGASWACGRGAGPGSLHTSAVAAAVAIRMVALPVAGNLVVGTARALGLLGSSTPPVLAFSLLQQYASPTCLLLLPLAVLAQINRREGCIANLLLWQLLAYFCCGTFVAQANMRLALSWS